MSDPLTRFDPPANWDDFPRSRSKREALRTSWHDTLAALTAGSAGPNYYNPMTTRIGDARPARVEWNAFPKRVEDTEQPLADKLRDADERDRQAEYCEWCVKRGAGGKITRVTFTSEVVEYWHALWGVDRARVLALYRQWISPRVALRDLELNPGDPDSPYKPRNDWNTGGEILPDRGGAMHMVVQSPANTLVAALGVVVGAANSGNDRPPGGSDHADPLIGLSVKRLVVRLGQRVSFSNPVGVYLQEPEFNRFELPAGAPREVHPRDFWTVVRGDRETGRALRAVYEVPRRLRFTVGDMKIDGRTIQHGSQIARTLKSGTYVTPIPRTS
ncbi:MAG TPA: hypothetical protein VGC93_01115 [Thermoanaerobaculia bacterium]